MNYPFDIFNFSKLIKSLSILNSDYFDDKDLGDTKKSNEDEDEKGELNGPRIYFSSRTHSQLSQSIKELKKTNYKNNSAVVLAGRDLLCINEDVQKLDNIGAKNQACKSKIGANCSCRYYPDHEKKVLNTRDYQENRVIDVEDLLNFGKKHSICPYFASKVLKRRSQVIFLPYNYLLDPRIRKAQKINLNEDVVIFDEGHNIEKTCEESVSVDLRSDHLACCIKEMANIYQFYNQSTQNGILDSATMDAVKEFTAEDLLLLKMMMHDLETKIDLKVQSIAQKKKREEKGDICEPDWIFNVLNEINLTFDNLRKVCEICDKVQAFLTCILPIKGPVAMVASSSLNSFKDFLSILFPDETEDAEEFKREFIKKFKIFIEIVEQDESTTKSQTSSQQKKSKKVDLSNWVNKTNAPIVDQNSVHKWILHVWCLSPSVGFKGLIKANVRSIILTSGTLAPLDSFNAEFGVNFECRIQNSHIIKASQMAIYPVSNSYDDTRLDSSYQNKNNIKYYKAIGDTIIDICARSPDGVLLFFSSYSVMNNSVQKWRDNEYEWKIWSRINKLKPVFQEAKDRDEFNEQVNRFRESVDNRKGGIFFGICRGKLSEGIDLSDRYSRAVILIGLPYPSFMEPRVKLKRAYLDQIKHQNFSSNTWYVLQMKRALNQAIGRAIRHKDDFGCVFLLDYRFEGQTKDLSKWCQNFVRNPFTYRDLMIEVNKFYENNKTTGLTRRVPAIASTSTGNEVQLNENIAVNSLELDFSLSEYTNKGRKNRASKKRLYESSLDEENTKKSKQISNQKVDNVFDLFDVSRANSGNSNEKKVIKKKERKHIEIEYESSIDVASTSNHHFISSSPVVLNDCIESSDSIIFLDE